MIVGAIDDDEYIRLALVAFPFLKIEDLMFRRRPVQPPRHGESLLSQLLRPKPKPKPKLKLWLPLPPETLREHAPRWTCRWLPGQYMEWWLWYGDGDD